MPYPGLSSDLTPEPTNMTIPTGYSVNSYGEMIVDSPRMQSYVRALRQAVRPGDTVVDIGAGPGLFSLLACRFGAGRVHAVEPDASIELLKTLARANGFDRQMICHATLSTNVELPARADVIISDLRGILPLFEGHIPTVIDARERMLAKDGVLIPRRDWIYGTLVEAPDLYSGFTQPWLEHDYPLDLSAGFPLAVNTWRKTRLRPDQMLAPAQTWAELDYRVISGPNLAGEMRWEPARTGTAHGLLLWFDAELAEGIGFSNAPGAPELVYGQAFFPLQAPIDLAPGDAVKIDLRADLVAGDYLWQWQTRVYTRDEPSNLKVQYRQSTFLGLGFAAENLRKRASDYRPRLSPSGEIDHLMLSMMDGDTPLETISRKALAEAPKQFQTWEEALVRAGELSRLYSR